MQSIHTEAWLDISYLLIQILVIYFTFMITEIKGRKFWNWMDWEKFFWSNTYSNRQIVSTWNIIAKSLVPFLFGIRTICELNIAYLKSISINIHQNNYDDS